MTKRIFEFIEQAKKILIITHVNPDGDTLGSACALKSYIGDKADILLQVNKDRNFPNTYSFLPYINFAKTLDDVKNIYDTVICVDVASIDRIVENAREIFNSAKVTLNIDHHKTNKGFADHNYVMGGISSAGEVLYKIFEKEKKQITLEMANCLYVSILTDTGCFKYETVTSETFAIVSNLLKLGVNSSEIAQKCYEQKQKAMIMLQAHCVSNAKFECDDKIAYTTVKNSDMQKFGAKDEHTEGICEVLRSLKPVEFAFVVKETGTNALKVSMRSKEKDVTQIVKKFGGGGHSRAAGCCIKKPLDEAIECILSEVKKYL